MRSMLKFVGLPKRHESWSSKAFSDYWLIQHGPLVMSQPELVRHFKAYVQNHLVEGWPGHGWEGVGEIWFDGLEDVQKAFSEPRYLKVIRPDELHLCDLAGGRYVVTRETFDHAAGAYADRYKLFRFLRRRPDTTHEAFAEAWREAGSRLVNTAEFAADVLRYQQCDLAFPSGDPMNTGSEGGLDADGIEILWLETPERWGDFSSTPAWRRHESALSGSLAVDGLLEIMTREHIMPVGAPPAPRLR
jgi:hypothetical protein